MEWDKVMAVGRRLHTVSNELNLKQSKQEYASKTYQTMPFLLGLSIEHWILDYSNKVYNAVLWVGVLLFLYDFVEGRASKMQ